MKKLVIENVVGTMAIITAQIQAHVKKNQSCALVVERVTGIANQRTSVFLFTERCHGSCQGSDKFCIETDQCQSRDLLCNGTCPLPDWEYCKSENKCTPGEAPGSCDGKCLDPTNFHCKKDSPAHCIKRSHLNDKVYHCLGKYLNVILEIIEY